MANLYDKASLVLPTSPAYKDGAIQAYKPLTSQGTFDFSRGSNLAATRVDANGLIEKGRENLLLHSNQFNTTWVPTGTSITSGQSGYDGSNNAWLLEVDATGAYRRITQSTGGSLNITNSIYAKAGTANFIVCSDVGGGGTTNVWFNLSNGTIGTIFGSNVIDAKIESVGGGWYRCSVAHQGEAPNYALWFIADSNNTTAGTAGANVYIQDAQQEVGLVATDYIETGASTAQAGILEDMPRLDYSGGDCPSLLLEPQRSNLFDSSEYTNTAYWQEEFGTTQEQNTTEVTSPEGVYNAVRLISANATSPQSIINVSPSITTGNDYSVSLFVKKRDYDYFQIRFTGIGSAFAAASVWFNIAEGSVGTIESGSGIVADIEDYGNGWYRIIATKASIASGIGGIRFNLASSDGVQNVVGDGSKGTYVYGFQIEQGSYPTSYIPTYGSSVTRSGDSCSKTGVADVIGQTEGTMFIDFVWDGVSNIVADNVIMSLDPQYYGTSTITISNYNGALYARVTSGVTIIQNLNASIILTSGTRYKIGFAYANNDFAFYVNGNLVNSASSGTPPATSSVYLNNDHPNTKNVNQSIVFPTRLSNAELAALTTI